MGSLIGPYLTSTSSQNGVSADWQKDHPLKFFLSRSYAAGTNYNEITIPLTHLLTVSLLDGQLHKFLVSPSNG